MSDFLMIVPEGWHEIPGDINELFSPHGGETGVFGMLENGPNSMDSVIEPLGLPPENMTVTDVRIFRDGGVLRMWVTYGPIN